jgi:outer membrane lipoprotein-sorting protein
MAHSQSDRGLEIAQEMKSREQGYENYSVDMTMVLFSTSGKETERKMRVISREY